jgi:hypothetical protein
MPPRRGWRIFDAGCYKDFAPHGAGKTLRTGMIYLEAVVTQCAILMNNHVQEHVLKVTSKNPWAMVRYNQDWTKFCTENKDSE